MSFDIIGDVHGCIDELNELIQKLGYTKKKGKYIPPSGRKLIFLGDITDRGPNSIAVIELVYQLVMEQKIAEYIPGNHCNKLYRFFSGNNVQQKHGLETTVAEWKHLKVQEQIQMKEKFMSLYEAAPLYLHFKEENLVIAHAGIKESFIGMTTGRVKSFVLYGDTTGQTDEQGRPIRRDWARNYQGKAWIIYGHTPVLEPRKVNRTINIDTGCVFGNKLTALQFPEQNFVSVISKQPFLPNRFTTFNKD
ncbi:bis(5'-nucleosyl)-tetraphosphatase PrpE [Oceanobacillus sp. J11TS1]|uniref:bis(5'-nucleosyl)-tetraphosphatase PrpE n=1 Tax=Oceanobacillus sp. J11TS1 TaxID=2807191 RepID=UPI001B17B998|nr:bis(5'-nucleosyl)-tetraphosphatase PrpE [Oceanobacillus sp. J11TS1]GIO22527.1 bis(5'-nucleosyl)-tetraphosphatase PrpE [asymmetrical] [Oceanobacillus sp. J11TS1]